MSLKNLNPQFGVLLLFILAAGIIRVVLGADANMSPIAMFTPVGAMALFGGASFSRNWKAYAFPLLTLFASDVILMQVFHKAYASGLLYKGWIWNYTSFALIVLLGQVIIKKVSPGNIILASVGAALVHFLISNFGVWVSGSTDITTGLPFTKDVAGLTKCYILAIPFMQYTLIGNLIYSTIFFGSFELVKRRLRLAR
ncbi:DUF6580 family putative transport protein [Chitinophaga nivalis]|uniref:Lysoplasmalogenase n=1 Tax=Chitinophaga nivalis TaxID=2991709 RepID=A0ABT3IW95_9BACT|nr:DUF6580 family putative transport protein [Chitinophaga nivalis]MCW3462041.1 hypothetical protein [Chitinophaga nivalis]MCW3488267.1 hypothetical protein [Chitinophaga nivalis]